MSAGVSTVPAVKARLLELFKAATNAEKTEVWGSRPNEDHQLAENVYIGDVRGERQWRNVGSPTPHQREEDYSIGVAVEVYREGTDVEGTEARAWEIVLAIEKPIAENPNLGLEGQLQTAIAGRFQSQSDTGTDGCMCKIAFDVQVRARI
jgi:hypothetical protein